MINDDFSTFKTHSAWFAQRGSQTLHDVHAGELEDFWRQRESSSAAKLPKWECLGPFNIAGRVTTLIAHPADPRRLWAGAAAGGVWGSADGGGKWKLLAAADTHNLPRRIGVLLPLKLADSMLYLGGITLNEPHPAGLYG